VGLSGKLLISKSYSEGENAIHIPLANRYEGVYFIELKSSNQVIYKKIIIN
jgi:hypothetical protein